MARSGPGIYRLKNGGSWMWEMVYQGQRHRKNLGPVNKTEAVRMATVLRGKVLTGAMEIRDRKKPKDLPFEKAVEEFLEWVRLHRAPKTYLSYQGYAKELLRSFRERKLGEVSPFLIERHKRRRKSAPVMVNRELRFLRSLYNRHIEWGRFEGANPVLRVKEFRESKGRERYLTPEEEYRLLEAAQEPLRTIVLTGLDAGLRIQAEALTLRKADVDLDRGRNGVLTVQAAYAKSGETRTLPLSDRLRAALQEQMSRSKGRFVFVKENDRTPYKTIRTAFETACRRAELKGVTAHTLRHTFASKLAMAGVDLRTIQELGGWKSLSMVERYAHLSQEHKAEAIARISANRPRFPGEYSRSSASTVSGRREGKIRPQSPIHFPILCLGVERRFVLNR